MIWTVKVEVDWVRVQIGDRTLGARGLQSWRAVDNIAVMTEKNWYY